MRRRASLTLCAVLAGCGGTPPAPRLPPAGTPGDDGSGGLARASVRFTTGDDEGGFEPRPAGVDNPYARAYGYGGFTYGPFGGALYGGLGGTPYGGFVVQPSWSSADRTPAYAVVGSADSGAIEGVVTWPRPPALPAGLAAPPGCPATAGPALGGGNTVEGVVVYLEKIAAGRALAWGARPLAVGGAVETTGCGVTPRVQVLGPLPSAVTLHHLGDAPLRLGVVRTDAPGPPGTAVVAQLGAGGAATVPVKAAGVYRVERGEERRPAAWIVAAAHPYYTITDARGRFVLGEVAPGEYQLVAWHPPVVTGVVDGVPTWGDPVVVRRTVVVARTAATRLTVELR